MKNKIRHVADFIIHRMNALGIDVPAGTRFRVYQEWLNEFLDFMELRKTRPELRLSEVMFQHLDIVLLECGYLRAIFNVITPADQSWLPTLRQIIQGHPVPNLDSNPLARNTQFELYVAAILKNAGLVANICEPDCTVEFQGLTMGFAAKRLSSLKQVRRRVRDASVQLARQKMPGLIALDLSAAMYAGRTEYSDRDWYDGETPGDYFARNLLRVLNQHESQIRRTADRRHVMGVMAITCANYLIHLPDDIDSGVITTMRMRSLNQPPHP